MPRRDPYLLTPGPLTTSAATKEAMLHDWGSRDAAFIDMNARVRARLLDIAGAAATHVAVPLQGSGTFIISKPKRKKAKVRQSNLKNPQRGARR